LETRMTGLNPSGHAFCTFFNSLYINNLGNGGIDFVPPVT